MRLYTFNRLQYSVNITLCTWKAKISCDLLYWNIRFIAVIWNGTCNISEVCLYRGEFGGMELF